MERELKKDFAAEIELIPGENGIFEVIVDGSQIFSKKSTKRFPDEKEISAIINAL